MYKKEKAVDAIGVEQQGELSKYLREKQETTAKQVEGIGLENEDQIEESDRGKSKLYKPKPVTYVPTAVIVKDQELVMIESVLSHDMAQMYADLPKDIKPIFKARGEEVAIKIQEMIASAEVIARKVLRLIRDWLGLVPNINKYYLEQESKIKTDKIMELANKHKETDTLT